MSCLKLIRTKFSHPNPILFTWKGGYHCVPDVYKIDFRPTVLISSVFLLGVHFLAYLDLIFYSKRNCVRTWRSSQCSIPDRPESSNGTPRIIVPGFFTQLTIHQPSISEWPGCRNHPSDSLSLSYSARSSNFLLNFFIFVFPSSSTDTHTHIRKFLPFSTQLWISNSLSLWLHFN